MLKRIVQLLVIPSLTAVTVIYILRYNRRATPTNFVPVREAIFDVFAIPGTEAIVGEAELQRLFLRDALWYPERTYAHFQAKTPEIFEMLVEPRHDICSSTTVKVEGTGHVLLAIIILANEKERRDWFRANWDKIGAAPESIGMFLVDEPKSHNEMINVGAEAAKHGDILMPRSKVRDTDGVRPAVAMQWVGFHCWMVEYVLYWNPDRAPINLLMLKQQLRHLPQKNEMIGDCKDDVATARGSVPNVVWPFTTYPLHPQGPWVVFSGAAAGAMSSAKMVAPRVGLANENAWFGLFALAGDVNSCHGFNGNFTESVNVETLKDDGCFDYMGLTKFVNNKGASWSSVYEYFARCERTV